MEPRIQYAQTSDGVSIAFWTLGAGRPFVSMPVIASSHIQLEWQWPEYRSWYESLAEKVQLVRYDARGSGLSDRGVTDFSLDAHLLDLQAVIWRLGLDRFVLAGLFSSGPVAIAYAARHPERVSHLILLFAHARSPDLLRSSPGFEAVRAMVDSDWEVLTETISHVGFGWSSEDAPRWAAFLRECSTPEEFRLAFRAHGEFDVTSLLPQVQSPTLVLHRRQLAFPPVELARDLAARIPNARLAVLEGKTLSPWVEMGPVLEAIEDFLAEGEPSAPAPAPPEAGAFRTVLFTDVEGSTSLTQRLGDAKARELLRAHERITREVLKAHSGTEVKTMGDGFMASFGSVTKAVECAIALQRAFAEREGEPEPIRVRIGLNAGEPIEEGGDLFGATVILAARIAGQAQGGEILASLAVRELCAGKGFLFADTGEVTLKGFEEPVRLFAVRWEA